MSPYIFCEYMIKILEALFYVLPANSPSRYSAVFLNVSAHSCEMSGGGGSFASVAVSTTAWWVSANFNDSNFEGIFVFHFLLHLKRGGRRLLKPCWHHKYQPSSSTTPLDYCVLPAVDRTEAGLCGYAAGKKLASDAEQHLCLHSFHSHIFFLLLTC